MCGKQKKIGSSYYDFADYGALIDSYDFEGNPVLYREINGWYTSAEDGKIRYYDNNVYRTGWQVIDGYKYYFSMSSGALLTGYTQIKSTKYLLNEDDGHWEGYYQTPYTVEESPKAKDVVLTEDGYYKYYPNGEENDPLTGWKVLPGNDAYYKYYFSSASSKYGAAITNYEVQVGGAVYSFYPSGALMNVDVLEDGSAHMYPYSLSLKQGAKNGLTLDEDGCYRYYIDGEFQSGWITTDGNKYLFRKADGSAVTSVNYKYGSFYYDFTEDGKMIRRKTGASSIYNITFAPGEGSGEDIVYNVLSEDALKYVLPENTFVKEGYEFFGWTDGVNTYPAGTKVQILKDTVFTAVWVEEQVEIIASGNVSDTITWSLNAKGHLSIEGSGEMPNFMGNAKVPWYNYVSSIKSAGISTGIKNISMYTFYGCAIESLDIPEGVEWLSDSAFNYCSNLKTVKIPASLTNADTYPFRYTNALESITVAEGNRNYSSENGVFFNKDKSVIRRYPPAKDVEEYNVPDSVISIYTASFMKADILKKVTMNNVQQIDTYAFENCSNLEEVYLGGTLKSIRTDAFKNCKALSKVYYDGTDEDWAKVSIQSGNDCLKNAEIVFLKVRETVATGDCGANVMWTFDSLGRLTISGTGEMDNYPTGAAPWYDHYYEIKEVIIKDGVTNIGDYAFFNHSEMFSVVIPEGVTSIGDHSFEHCASLTKVALPKGVTSIGSSAFANCRALNELDLPKSLTTVEAYAFDSCNRLAKVLYHASYASWEKISLGEGNDKLRLAKFTYQYTQYTVTFVDHDGTVLKTQKIEEGLDATAPTAPTRDGYTFIGWDKDFSNVTEDITVTAQYEENYVAPEIKYYTVTFVDYNGETLGLPQLVKEGEGANAPSAPAREGYTFTGWDVDFSNVTENLTVTAQYKETVTYRVVFFDEIGNVLSEQMVEEGKSAVAPEAPAKSGYTFIGWDKDFSNVTGELRIYTKYEKNKVYYTVTFVDYDGTVLETQSVEEGKGATATVHPTREDYNFIGWNGYTGIINKDRTFTALYDVKGLGSIKDTALFGNNLNSSNAYTSTFLRWTLYDTGILTINGKGEMVTLGNIAPGWSDYASSIKEVRISSGVDKIWGFIDCNKITKVTIEDGPKVIRENAFSRCTSLKEINLSDTITTIEKGAFFKCAVESIDLKNVENVYEYAFDSCTPLKEVKIGKGLKALNSLAFYRCPNLENYIVDEENESFSSFDGGLLNKTGTVLYNCPPKKVNYNIPMETTTISANAFKGCAVENVAGGMNVTTIGASAFADCEKLVNFLIPQGVTQISDRTFYNCKSLNNVILGDNVTSIGNYAFYGCSALENMFFGNGLKTIGEQAFFSTGLRNVSLPASVRTINENAFAWCENLDNVMLNEGLVTLYKRAFANCTSLRNITIPSTVKVVKAEAFDSCSGLLDVIIRDGVETIENSAFSAKNLQRVAIPVSVKTIGENAFGSSTNNTLIIDYEGTELQWNEIAVSSTNTALNSATIHFAEPDVKEYTVTFVNFDGSIIETQTVKEGMSATAPAVPYREGYNFIGWDKDFSNVTGDITVTAQYEQIMCMVTFYGYEGPIEAQLIPYGGSATAPDVPSYIDGYTFAGWDTDFSYVVCDFDVYAIYVMGEPGPGPEPMPEDEGYFGDNLKWHYDGSGKLTISGNGIIPDYDSYYESDDPAAMYGIPWEMYMPMIYEVEIQEGITGIDYYGLGSLPEARSLYLPASLTYLHEQALSGFIGLEYIEVSENSETFMTKDFMLFSKDETELILCVGHYPNAYVEFDEKVRDIAPYAFENCTYIEAINVSPDNKNFRSVDGVLFGYWNGYNNAIIKYPAGKWNWSYEIPEGTEAVAPGAFEYAMNLSELYIPASVKYIDGYCFKNAMSLSMITISEDNENYASVDNCITDKDGLNLYYCPTGIVPDGVQEIWEGSFDLNGIYEITIPASVIQIHSNVFPNYVNQINYIGTREQWNAIYKSETDNDGLRYAYINCING